MRSSAARPLLMTATAVALLAAACVSGGESSKAANSAKPSEATTPSQDAKPDPLVGRWEQVHHCRTLVGALKDAGLEATIPAVLLDFFPDQTPRQLSEKEDPCAGAAPFVHSHFFDASGVFGSLDENLNQVDDGTYTITGDTLTIGDSTFRVHIAGDTLTIDPEITNEELQEALAAPLEWSAAGWMVAVSYPGTAWTRVDCEGWC
jgi:hypothetical protein